MEEYISKKTDVKLVEIIAVVLIRPIKATAPNITKGFTVNFLSLIDLEMKIIRIAMWILSTGSSMIK